MKWILGLFIVILIAGCQPNPAPPAQPLGLMPPVISMPLFTRHTNVVGPPRTNIVLITLYPPSNTYCQKWYLLTSTNLKTWTTIATNPPPDVWLTNIPAKPGAHFFRMKYL